MFGIMPKNHKNLLSIAFVVLPKNILHVEIVAIKFSMFYKGFYKKVADILLK